MIRIHRPLKASRLASNISPPPNICFTHRKRIPSLRSPHITLQIVSRHSTISIYPRQCKHRTIQLLPQTNLSQQRARHCSYRHAMCKRDVDAPGGSIDSHREVLPTDVKPLHYALTLEPDFEKFTYSGKVVIEYV